MPSGKAAILIFSLASLTAASDHASPQCLGNVTTCDATSLIQVHRGSVKERMVKKLKTAAPVKQGDCVYHGTRGIVGAANAVAQRVDLSKNTASVACVPLTGRSFFTTTPGQVWFLQYMFADKAEKENTPPDNPATGYSVGFKINGTNLKPGKCSVDGTAKVKNKFAPPDFVSKKTCMCPGDDGVSEGALKCTKLKNGAGICDPDADLIETTDEQIWATTNKFVACYQYKIQAYYNDGRWQIVSVEATMVDHEECQHGQGDSSCPATKEAAVAAWGPQPVQNEPQQGDQKELHTIAEDSGDESDSDSA